MPRQRARREGADGFSQGGVFVPVRNEVVSVRRHRSPLDRLGFIVLAALGVGLVLYFAMGGLEPRLSSDHSHGGSGDPTTLSNAGPNGGVAHAPSDDGITAYATNVYTTLAPGILDLATNEQYLVARVTLMDNGQSDLSYSMTDFSVKDGSGLMHQADFGPTTIRGTRLGGGTLVPGASVTGDVAFIVSLDARTFTLQWAPGMGSGSVVLPVQ